jgi:hypothetical protein
MFCPQCGQQQVSETTRFCSRCGIAIGGIVEWLAHGEGNIPGKKKAPLAGTRKEVKRGAKIMFLSGVLAPVFFALCFLVDNPAPLLVPLSIFLLGFSLICYAHLFGEEFISISKRNRQPSELGPLPANAALPPASGIGNVVNRPVRTNELVQPASVTERTTKLLDME